MSSSSNIRTMKESIGGKIMVYQQKTAHSKRLDQIYNRQPKRVTSQKQLKKTVSKKQKMENYEHHKNIEHLYDFISREKSMADRIKDPHDFFAYPTYFFRDVPTLIAKKPTRKGSAKTKLKTASGQSSQGNRKYGIDAGTVKENLPFIQNFNEEELQEYTDSITRMVLNYNLNTTEKLNFLKQCVLKTVQPHYPPQFPQLVEEIFTQLLQSLNFQD